MQRTGRVLTFPGAGLPKSPAAPREGRGVYRALASGPGGTESWYLVAASGQRAGMLDLPEGGSAADRERLASLVFELLDVIDECATPPAVRVIP